MALDPLPAILPPTARQQTVVQSNDPVRELTVDMPLQSLTSSRVVVVVFSTISGGTRSHIPSSSVWTQLSLGGTNGFTQLGNILVSAWVSRAGTPVYAGGLFRFAGLVGLAPEHATAVAVELTDMRDGTISLSSRSWNESYTNVISGQASASGNTARGVLAVGVAEDQHNFLAPTTGHTLLSQTANTGFFSAPFSVVSAYKGQSSNDDMSVALPYDSVASRNGLLLFNAVNAASAVTSVSSTMSTSAFISYPGQSFTTSAYLHNGGDAAHTISAAVEFEALTSQMSTDASLNGELIAAYDSESNIYSQVIVAATTDALLDAYNIVQEEVFAEILGAVTTSGTTSSAIVNSRADAHTGDGFKLGDLFHLTNSYIFSGQSFHTTDGLPWAELETSHTTDAAIISVVTLSGTVDSYIQSPEPPSVTSTSDAYILTDNIIAMTGFELQNEALERANGSPVYSFDNPFSVTALAKRPGSQGGYGLRIVNPASLGNHAYLIPQFSLRTYQSLHLDSGTYEPGLDYSQLWATFHFRCNTAPTDWEMLLSDINKQLLYPPNTIDYGYSFLLALRAQGAGFKLAVGRAKASTGLSGLLSSEVGYYPLELARWYKLEIGFSVASGALTNASFANPVLVQIYLDGVELPFISPINFPQPFNGSMVVGMQQRFSTYDYAVDIDDFVVSTNRIGEDDLSIIVLPAKANGTYSAWTGTPADDYTDVNSIPYDPAAYQQSTSISQRFSVKLYDGADPNPYPGEIHAANFVAVQDVTSAASENTFALFLREGLVDLEIGAFDRSCSNVFAGRSVLLVRSPFDDTPWRDALYDMEFGVQQVLNSSTNKTHLLAVNLLVSPTSQEHTSNAALFGEITSTHTTGSSLGKLLDITTDANIDISTLKFHTADFALFSLGGFDHTTDAVRFGETGDSHSADAMTDLLIDQTTDAVIVSVRGSVQFTDVAISGELDSSHEADATVWSQVDLPHDTSAIQYRLVETLYTSDAATLASYDLTHLANALRIGSPSVTHDTGSLKKATVDLTATADALKFLRVDISHLTNSIKAGERTSQFVTNSALGITNVFAKFHTTLSTLRTSYTSTTSADALLKLLSSASSTTNAIVFGEAGAQATTNSRIVIPTAGYATHLATSSLKGEVTNTITSNSLLRNTSSLTLSTNSFLEFIGELSHSTNAFKFIQGNRDNTTSALLYLRNDLTQTTNAVMYTQLTATTSSSTVLFGEGNLSVTSNSILFGEATATEATNSLLKKAIDQTNTSNSWLAFEKLFTSNSYIGISAQQDQAIASSLRGESSASQTVNSLKYLIGNLSHTVSSSLLGEVTVYHVNNATLLGLAESVHSTLSALAIEALHDSNSILFGQTSGSHSTGSMLVNDDLGIFEQNEENTFEGAF